MSSGTFSADSVVVCPAGIPSDAVAVAAAAGADVECVGDAVVVALGAGAMMG
jgi:hypothetical protein